MPTVIPANEVLIALEYDPTGLEWCRVYDIQVTGWLVDETGSDEPQPIVSGQFPPPAPVTSPVVSPQWALLATPGALVAGVIVNPAVTLPGPVATAWRGSFADFLDFLATNNGTRRKLESRLGVSRGAYNTFLGWSRGHPDLVLGSVGFGQLLTGGNSIR